MGKKKNVERYRPRSNHACHINARPKPRVRFIRDVLAYLYYVYTYFFNFIFQYLISGLRDKLYKGDGREHRLVFLSPGDVNIPSSRHCINATLLKSH